MFYWLCRLISSFKFDGSEGDNIPPKTSLESPENRLTRLDIHICIPLSTFTPSTYLSTHNLASPIVIYTFFYLLKHPPIQFFLDHPHFFF